MKQKLSLFLVLGLLVPVIAGLLASPSLTGKAGIFLFRHTYVRDFPSALLSTAFILSGMTALCELMRFVLPPGKRLLGYTGLAASSVALFVYVHNLFTHPGYRLAGSRFIAGAHLLPLTLAAIVGYYLYKEVKKQKNRTKLY